ncbi:hypothetical protein ABPG72_005327 [Tetrahymena utriculariae]
MLQRLSSSHWFRQGFAKWKQNNNNQSVYIKILSQFIQWLIAHFTSSYPKSFLNLFRSIENQFVGPFKSDNIRFIFWHEKQNDQHVFGGNKLIQNDNFDFILEIQFIFQFNGNYFNKQYR